MSRATTFCDERILKGTRPVAMTNGYVQYEADPVDIKHFKKCTFLPDGKSVLFNDKTVASRYGKRTKSWKETT
jgi:hypothetical protein